MKVGVTFMCFSFRTFTVTLFNSSESNCASPLVHKPNKGKGSCPVLWVLALHSHGKTPEGNSNVSCNSIAVRCLAASCGCRRASSIQARVARLFLSRNHKLGPCRPSCLRIRPCYSPRCYYLPTVLLAQVCPVEP
jgi:hypothetical protein